MASLLQEGGYEISVVTPKIYGRSRYFEEQNGIKVYRFPFLARNKLLIEYEKIPFFRMILYYVTGFFLTIYAILRNKCDAIHVHWAIPTGLIGVWIKALIKKTFIVTIHGSDLRIALDKPGFLRKIFMHVCKQAVHLNCVSEEQKIDIERLGIISEKISTIPMGVDEAFLETGKKKKIKSNNQSFVILSNRNLLPIYNLSLLIRAIPMVLEEEPKTRFLIAGEGSEKENLGKEVEDLKLGPSVQFLGRVPHEEMPNLLSQSDVYVSTSACDGTSVSLLEALACGAFPVVTDIPSNREWIADGCNGFLVSEEDEKLLARRIVQAIRDRGLLEEADEINRRIVKERAYWRENIKRITELYQRFA